MRDITTIPTEIWDYIITGACTDGGYTRRSLALANKFLHSQSLSNRLSSIRLTSLASVENFLSFLDAQATRTVSLDYRRGPTPTTESATREWNERFVPSMIRLFALASPTLRTLCVVTEKPPIRLPAFSYSLPVLEELSVHQSLDLFFPGPGACERKWNYNFEFRLPALRRLHIIYDLFAEPDDSALGIMRSLVPYKLQNLTHIRISDLCRAERDFTHDLGTAMGIPYVPYRSGLWRPAVELASSSRRALLPNLRNVVVHGTSHWNTGQCGTNSFYWMELCDQVQTTIPRLAKQIWDIDVSVVALNRPERRKWHWHERLFDDWVSRIEGGTGCWVESEDEEAKLEAKLEVYHKDDPPLPEVVDYPLPDEDDDL